MFLHLGRWQKVRLVKLFIRHTLFCVLPRHDYFCCIYQKCLVLRKALRLSLEIQTKTQSHVKTSANAHCLLLSLKKNSCLLEKQPGEMKKQF